MMSFWRMQPGPSTQSSRAVRPTGTRGPGVSRKRRRIEPIVTLLEGRTLLASSVITTYAGNGIPGTTGDGGPATSAEINAFAVALDAKGDLFISEYSLNVIREVTPSGVITTVAGNGTLGHSGDGGPATKAELNYPKDIAVDDEGDLFIADNSNSRVREVDLATGIITTVAGNGTDGYSGDGGPATQAELDAPDGVAVNAAGTELFIADYNNDVIREVNLETGIINTVAGSDMDYGDSGDGGLAANATLDGPTDVTLDSSGNLYITQDLDSVIRKVTTAGVITTVAGNGTNYGYSGDGGPATQAALYFPGQVAVDAAGDIFIPDNQNCVVREVNTGGIINTVVGNGVPGYSGDGGAPTSAELDLPECVAVSPSGNLFIADYGNGVVREVAPSTGTPTPNPTPTTVVKISVEKIKTGKHKTAEVIVIRFSAALNPGDAQNISDYGLATVPKKKKQKGKAVALASAAYNSTAFTVTLRTRQALVLNPPLRLTIQAGSLLDALGYPVDNGANPVATIT